MVPSFRFYDTRMKDGIDDVIGMNFKFRLPKCNLQIVVSLIEIKDYFQTPTEPRYS